jgi:hypothetical protein
MAITRKSPRGVPATLSDGHRQHVSIPAEVHRWLQHRADHGYISVTAQIRAVLIDAMQKDVGHA